ncbi:hypothetical protein [Streptomyces sp. NPDC005438]|uniref:hypothetical protein n=1 Tax=Streptomyces sp. NPDC005438 TaxID=3156880 RepID=UPI0033BC302C
MSTTSVPHSRNQPASCLIDQSLRQPSSSSSWRVNRLRRQLLPAQYALSVRQAPRN